MKNRIIAPPSSLSLLPRVIFIMIGMYALPLWPTAQSPSTTLTAEPLAIETHEHTDMGCLIVVGAFEVKANADRKVKYLAKKGLKNLYRGTHNGKEYLGVPIECDTPGIDDYLSDFQYRYIADAWVFTLPEEQ